MQWLKPLKDWTGMLIEALDRDPAIVRVVLAAVRGSAPREPGVTMLVGRNEFSGTIGGGQLEWEALAAARQLLDSEAPPARLQRFVLAADLGQCCGGVVELWLERFTAANLPMLRAAWGASRAGAAVLVSTFHRDDVTHRIERGAVTSDAVRQLLRATGSTPGARLVHDAGGGVSLLQRLDLPLPSLWLYGAGHVGQALAKICIDLPISLTWVDTRAELFPPQVPDAVRMVHVEPVASVADAPAGARFLVLTHSHALDYALCRAILERGDFASAGLIGSKSKAARFRSRLARDGLSAGSIARLMCPIGIEGISCKAPAAIAVSIAAQLLHDLSINGEGNSVAEASAIDGAGARAGAGTNANAVVGPVGGAGCDERECAACRPVSS